MAAPKVRCINLDWLEVYCLESNDHYPCNAEYFRNQGYNVKERDYGTRVYKEMFTICNDVGDPLIEIRRNPASGNSDFQGLVPESTHIRLPNWMLYYGSPIDFLRDFLVRHEYIFKRIYRIDIAYDFEYFDSGDQPKRFAQRYFKGVYRKINQAEIHPHGEDRWTEFEWNSIKWGSPSSMVTTKLYDKTLELRKGKTDKPWIKTAWMVAGLIDNPATMAKRNSQGEWYQPEIWRVEFSMMSAADGWIVLDWVNGKRQKKQTIPHRLNMFDSPDKLWKRFQDLAYNYFHFKVQEYKKPRTGIAARALGSILDESKLEPQRKDRCRDKILFYWDKGHEFCRLSAAPSESRPHKDDMALMRKLQLYKNYHADHDIRQACDVLIHEIERVESLRFIPYGDNAERRALQIALQRKIGGDERSVLALMEEIVQLLKNDEIW